MTSAGGKIELAMGSAKASSKIDDMAQQISHRSNQKQLEDVELQEEAGEKEEGVCGDRTLKTRIAQGVAGASIIVNIVAIVIEQSAIMFIAGLIALVIGPIVIMQQFKLQDTDSMREVQNKLRHNVNDLQKQNNKFAAENTLLEEQVSNLQEQEARLQAITAEQGSNVNRLVEITKEYKRINEAYAVSLRGQTVAMVVSAVVNTDYDANNQTFDEYELFEFYQKIEVLEHKKLIRVNWDLLKSKMSTLASTPDGVLGLAKQLEDEEKLPENERILTYIPIDEA